MLGRKANKPHGVRVALTQSEDACGAKRFRFEIRQCKVSRRRGAVSLDVSSADVVEELFHHQFVFTPMNTFAMLSFVLTFLIGATAGAWLNSLTTEPRGPSVIHRLRD
jgi:hypothetical protein